MTQPIISSEEIRQHATEYLDEVRELVDKTTSALADSGDFRAIYKTCLATDCILSHFQQDERPSLRIASGFVSRIPILVATGQFVGACAELRRFIESTLFTVYFTDHPIEWEKFQSGSPGKIATDRSRPISFCAFQARSFYSSYAAELFQSEPSGLAQQAAEEIGQHYGQLSTKIHAQSTARRGRIEPGSDTLGPAQLGEFQHLLQVSCSAGCLMLAALFSARFDTLPPAERSWFDWLLGQKRSKQLRADRFGLARRVS